MDEANRCGKRGGNVFSDPRLPDAQSIEEVRISVGLGREEVGLHGSIERCRADQADRGRFARIGIQEFWPDRSTGLSRVAIPGNVSGTSATGYGEMAHSFKLGTHYRNREGEYQVVEIHGDEMTIRYSAGKTIRTDISTQQRILDNLEIENDIAEDERLRSERSKREPRDTQVVRGSTPKFEGFSAADFGSLEGSSWRGRDALGGVLRDYLQAQTGVHFQSWAVRRRLEVHLARPDK